MHIVFLNQYYPPDDAPTGVMLQEVAEKLVRGGHQVTVLCGPGGYAECGLGSAECGLQTTADGEPRVVVRRVRATRFGRRMHLGKLVDYATFYFGVGWNLLWLRAERVVALTTPPYLSVLARGMSKLRGGDHGHWVMDLYPDVMVAHGMLAEGGVVARILGLLTRWGFGGRRCAVVSTLGPDMAERVGRYVGSGREIEVVPLWAMGETPAAEEERRCAEETRRCAEEERVGSEEDVRAWRESRGWGEDELVLMYSGNMGLGHRFGEFLEVAGSWEERDGAEAGSSEAGVSEAGGRWPEAGGAEAGGAEAKSLLKIRNTETPKLRNSEAPKLRFVFTGGGKRKGEIEAFVAAHPDGAVEVGDYVSRGDLAVHLASADVHLVSLEPSWDGTMVPSKLQGIFSIGRPVLFVGSRTCAIGRWILESGGGWVVAPGDVAGLAAAIGEAGDEEERRRRGQAAREFAAEHFDRDRNTAALADVFGGNRPPLTANRQPPTVNRPHKITLALLWFLSIGIAGLVVALSWAADSRMAMIAWIPSWLATWADSGGVMETMRTGIAMAVASFLFTLAWRVSGWKHWILGGIGLACGLLLVAEGGQFFLPARTPSWGDLGWGSVGVVLGVLVASGGRRRV